MSSDILVLEPDMQGATAMHTAKMIGDALETEYPGWLWHIEVKGGVAIIKSMHASPKHGFVINLVDDFYSASELKKISLRAGGEMLERLNMPRRRADLELIESKTPRVGWMEYAA